jgi:hypothetical protein
MSNSVRYYDNTMSGAPSLPNSAGSAIGILTACLQDGFGSVTVDSLVVASNIATATVSAGHQFSMILSCGPVIRIEGASPSGLNGDWRITVTGSTTFTFSTTGISDQTATGTITAKRAPAGFTKTHTATNKAVYQSDDVTGPRLYLRIDDTNASYSRLRGYRAITDLDADTGTYPFPTDAQLSGGAYLYKATGSNRPWWLYSDGQAVYFFCDTTNDPTNVYGGFFFGNTIPNRSGDVYAVGLIASTTSTGTHWLRLLGDSTGSWLASDYKNESGSIVSARYSHEKTSSLGSGGESFPAAAGLGLRLYSVEAWESTTNSRAMMPGLLNPIHSASGSIFADYETTEGDVIKSQITGGNYKCFIGIKQEWR